MLCGVACGAQSADRDGSGGGGAACAAYTPQASPDEISKTPRPNDDAEVLAIEASNAFVAPDALYHRIAAELSAIVVSEPTVSNLHPSSPKYSKSPARVELDADGWQDVVSGAYAAWNCPNQAYGAALTLNTQWDYASLEFGEKRFHAELLAKEYAALPNVTNSHQDTYVYDGPDACLEIQGDEHFYVFDKASGDCPSGCMEHLYFGFQAGPGSVLTKLGEYDPKQSAEPEWFTQLADCRTRL